MAGSLGPEDLILLARADFWCFIELTFDVLHPGQKLVFAEYLELLASVLGRVEEGKRRRVLINLPPRHMKSVITSVLFVAWCLGRKPGTRFICISYSDDLAHDLSNLTRRVLRSPIYRWIFPNVELEKSSEDYIRTTAGGFRYATSVGSTITGFGADVIIIDDPLQPEDVSSETAKREFRSWLGSSVQTRFNDQSKGAMILVMHRLAPDDPSADFEPTADFVLRFPLIADRDETKYIYNGRIIYHRKEGQLLNPRLMDGDTVAQLRHMLPPHVFQSQYQQRPVAGGSGMYSVDQWPRYAPLEVTGFELLIHSWDIGATINGNASVCISWGLGKNKEGRDSIFLLSVRRIKAELPEVIAAIKAADKTDQPALIVLDERGVGLGAQQQLAREGYRHVLGSTATSEALERDGIPVRRPGASKVHRFGNAVLAIADRRVLIPSSAPWLEAFLSEVAGFPNIPDNDQVDSMSQIAGNLDTIIRRARYLRRTSGISASETKSITLGREDFWLIVALSSTWLRTSSVDVMAEN